MNRRIRTFFSRVAATVRSTPAESLLIVFFLVYGFLMVADLLHEDQSEAASYLWLYPFGFTLAYILNCLLPAGAVRWVYYLSPLLLAPFFRLDVESWIGEPSFLTALGLCPVAVLLCRWRKDNASFVGDAVHYARNALFAFGLAGIAHLLVMAIYYSLRYIFPALPLGDENKVMEYLAVLFYIGVMPLVFLTFDRGQHGDYAPVRIVDILVNYVLTPALLIYTVILYAYFIKITATWSLPEGGIAYMVFAFTIIAVVVKAYLPLMGKRTLEWFYGRFSLVSLPALAMFWIGVGRRIGEYGLTEGRIYLLICGAAMTFTVLMFLVPRQAAYRWPVLGGALLFSLFAFFPGITASELAVDSQQKRFDAVAARLGMLDVEGRLILEKRPEATEAQQEDYSALYDAYEYVYRHSDSMDMEARYGIPDIDRLTDEVMPDNMPRGQLYGNGNSVYLTDFGRRLDVDIRKYASLHSLRHDYSDDGPWQDPSYYYRTDSVGLTIFTPEGDTLFSRPLSLILERQLAKVGIGPVPDISTAGELEKRFGEMMFYEDGNFGIVFESMEISIDGATLTLTGLGAKELLLKE